MPKTTVAILYTEKSLLKKVSDEHYTDILKGLRLSKRFPTMKLIFTESSLKKEKAFTFPVIILYVPIMQINRTST